MTHSGEPGWVINQNTPALSEHGGIPGIPREPEPLGDTGDVEMLRC